MKGMLISFLIVLPQFVMCQRFEGGIQFDMKSSWEEVKQKAARENKMIFIDAYTTWCVPCKKMEKEVYTNDTVAKYFNQNFVSVKIQFDTTKKDSKRAKGWHKISNEFQKKYEIQGYPTFFFFNSKGELINKSIGYQVPAEFIRTANESINSSELNVELQNYEQGIFDSAKLKELAGYAYKIGDRKLAKEIGVMYLKNVDKSSPNIDLIQFVKSIANDNKLADSLTSIYKHKYFDTFSDSELLQTKVLTFAYFYLMKFFRPSDRIFYLSCHNQNLIDKLTFRKASENIRYGILFNVIKDKIKERKALLPNWDSLLNELREYNLCVNVDSVLRDYKIGYYQYKKDWPDYTKSIIERVNAYGEYGLGYRGENVDFNYNNLAWELFQHSNDSSELQIALRWADSAVSLRKRTQKQVDLGNFMDTKANILYKLGYRDYAIKIEEEAALLDPQKQSIKDDLKKMRRGLPTW